jgi:hypothetical protein
MSTKEPVYSKIIQSEKKIKVTPDGKQEIISQGVDLKTLSNFFTSEDRILEIPSYQRPYTWDDGNIVDLINDIKKLKNNEDASWFLGSIFITSDESNNKIQLLDGQQRITTIQILIWQLCVLHKHLNSKLTEEIYEELENSDEEILTFFNAAKTNLESILKNNNKTYSNSFVQPRFLLRNEIANIWIEFIQQIDKLRNKDQAKNYVDNNFFKQLDIKYKDGFPSAFKIKEAFKSIEKILNEDFYNKLSNPHLEETPSIKTLILDFNEFCNALLNKIWLIEIELIQANDSLKIFEGINNRGKGLSLTDKLRFKCLINLKDERNKNQVRDYWTQAYSLIQYNKENGFLKGDDDFFNYLLISLSDCSLDDEKDKIRYFEEKFILNSDESQNETKIIEFCEKMILILLHLKSLNEFNNRDFQISESIKLKRLDNAKALYALFRKVIHFSDNSRFLYFNLLFASTIKKPEDTDEYVLLGMMNIVKVVMHFEVFKKLQSNSIRTFYLSIVRKVNNSIEGEINRSLYHKLYFDMKENPSFYQIDVDDFEINGFDIINNFISGNDSNKDILILYFYSYHLRYDDLRNQIQGYKKQETHLEHLLPQSWEKNWKEESDFLITDVIYQVKKHIVEFPFLDSCLNLISEKGDRLLLVYDINKKSQKHPKESIGQWIGNKLVTHSKVNIASSNKNWIEKKNILNASNYIKIPSENLPNVGINHFNNFDLKAIITRSVNITGTILNILKSKGNWESFKF